MVAKPTIVAIVTIASVLAGPALARTWSPDNDLRDSGRSVPEVNMPAPRNLPALYPAHVHPSMADVSTESDDFPRDQQ